MTPARTPCAGVVWSRVEDDFHVASRRGAFIGYVDRRDGGVFLAFDRQPHLLGRFATLPLAMSAVARAQPDPEFAAVASASDAADVVLVQVRGTQKELSHG